jgi:hypothetical protein
VDRRIGGGPLIALSLLAGIIVPASSAFAATPPQPGTGVGNVGIRLLDASAHSGNDPRVRSYIVDRVAPGTTIRRRVEITNSTASTVEVAVYPAAARLSGDRFAFGPGHSQNEVSSWISVSRAVLRLPPGSKAFDTVTISVPPQASAGERYAVVWAEVSASPAAAGVTLVNRVGVRTYLSIGPGGAPSSDFGIGELVAKRSATGQPLVVAEIHNTGGSTVGLSGDLTLSNGPGGLRAGPFPVEPRPGLAPGDSELLIVRLDRRVPRGPWRAHLRLRSGTVRRVVDATLTFPRLGAAPSEQSGPAWPRYLTSIGLAFLAVGTRGAQRLLSTDSGKRSS